MTLKPVNVLGEVVAVFKSILIFQLSINQSPQPFIK